MTRLKNSDYYEILGVHPSARDQDIRQAYRQLCRAYHPDTTTLAPAEALEKFLVVNEAYTILSHPAKRIRYDQILRAAQPRPVAPMAQPTQPLEIQDRPLSSTELFALFMLGFAFVACLLLAVFASIK